MKRFLPVLFIFVFSLMSVNAENLADIKYKNIREKQRIAYDSENGIWKAKAEKKAGGYFIKTKGETDGYMNSDNSFGFTTGCDYEFITDGRLIGYSNKDLQFYEISFKDGYLTKEPLIPEDVKILFPDYRIILLSEFSKYTNSLKIKKEFGELKIILFNDLGYDYDDYTFTTSNAKIEKYYLRGFLTVSKHGMIQFSKTGDSESPWYVLLVR